MKAHEVKEGLRHEGEEALTQFQVNALNKNPFAPIVPCHRVVAKNGLGGFSRGLKEKIKLLRSEGYAC